MQASKLIKKKKGPYNMHILVCTRVQEPQVVENNVEFCTMAFLIWYSADLGHESLSFYLAKCLLRALHIKCQAQPCTVQLAHTREG